MNHPTLQVSSALPPMLNVAHVLSLGDKWKMKLVIGWVLRYQWEGQRVVVDVVLGREQGDQDYPGRLAMGHWSDEVRAAQWVVSFAVEKK